MAFDAFLKLTPESGSFIKGEAKADGHQNEIEILSFAWGVTNPTDSQSGKATGRAHLSSFDITKKSDLSSTSLFQNCCSGQHYKEALITIRKAGGEKPVEYLKYKFSTVFVGSLKWDGEPNDDLPLESISFHFTKVEVTYTPDDHGKPGSPNVVGWDVAAGKKV